MVGIRILFQEGHCLRHVAENGPQRRSRKGAVGLHTICRGDVTHQVYMQEIALRIVKVNGDYTVSTFVNRYCMQNHCAGFSGWSHYLAASS